MTESTSCRIVGRFKQVQKTTCIWKCTRIRRMFPRLYGQASPFIETSIHVEYFEPSSTEHANAGYIRGESANSIQHNLTAEEIRFTNFTNLRTYLQGNTDPESRRPNGFNEDNASRYAYGSTGLLGSENIHGPVSQHIGC